MYPLLTTDDVHTNEEVVVDGLAVFLARITRLAQQRLLLVRSNQSVCHGRYRVSKGVMNDGEMKLGQKRCTDPTS